MDKDEIQQERRGFLKQFGATMGAAGLGAAGLGVAGSRPVHAAAPKGNIPNRPVKVGHITFLTGAAELLGGPGQRVDDRAGCAGAIERLFDRQHLWVIRCAIDELHDAAEGFIGMVNENVLRPYYFEDVLA